MFLYSVKYWPDVNNYINANITIKRIPKISEIEVNLTVYDTTDINETTDLNDFTDITTEYYGNDYFSLDEVENRRRRRVEQDIDYSDIPTKEDIDDYIFEVQPERDLVKDLAQENELTAKETDDVEILPGIFYGKEYLELVNTEVSDVDVPDFENVNLESESVDAILKFISNLFEEFVADFDLSSQFNVVRNNSNKTTIFIKTFETDKLNETFENAIENKKNVNVTYLNTTNKSKDAEVNTELPTKEHFGATIMSGKNETKKLRVETLHNPVLDVNELSKKVKENEILDTDSIDYDLIDNSTDYPIIDYIDLYKDTTNEDVNMKTTVLTYPLDDTVGIQITTLNTYINEERYNKVYTEDCTNSTDIEKNIFPFVTAIFIKNETSNQFDYYCDGALLSETIIITAASCIQKPNATADDILVILGKRSLREMTNNEMISKIKEVHIHDNFTGSNHDVAIIEMAEPATLSDRIQLVRLSGDRGKSATTGWAISGTLTLIPFEDEPTGCNETLPENTFCAVYGNDVSVCPSYGGLYATRGIEGWFLRGIRSGDPTNKVTIVLMVVLSCIYRRPVIHLFFHRCCGDDIENDQVIFENFGNNFLRERLIGAEIVEVDNATLYDDEVDDLSNKEFITNVHDPVQRLEYIEKVENDRLKEDIEAKEFENIDKLLQN
ncbi:unnamed protein product [Danaus chrysippus]|uniref:(African queen) hypothetical protein n=1 Tax=Danaus chrysippus TaxID=151541 RepID=A0A8J2QZP4_9NEOP|nr:unnamed protein product [Danaus chrysippus]